MAEDYTTGQIFEAFS